MSTDRARYRLRPLPLLAALGLTACASSIPVPWGLMEGRYEAAIRDAERADPSEVVHDLVALVPGEPGLLWKGSGAERRVLLVSWADAWHGATEPGTRLRLDEPLWVTPAPQIQERCRGFDNGRTERDLRLDQLLGMPPRSTRRRFVALWVRPADVFRPCPDPSVATHTCPAAPAGSVLPSADPQVRDFLADWGRKAYTAGGFPWTRLGYTYDWGSPYGEEGLAEFVVRPGSEVEVEAVAKTGAYCRPRKPGGGS